MANKYAVASGSWSSTATWSDTDGGAGGASLPANNDTVFISAGVSVLMDVDLSGFADGLISMTIRGDSVSPGMLYFKDGTDGYLKFKTNLSGGSAILGTDAPLYGRILANSDGVWENTGSLSSANTATILMGTGISIQGKYLDIKLYCHQPATKYVEIYGIKVSDLTVDFENSRFTTTTPYGIGGNQAIAFKGADLPAPLQENFIYFLRYISTTAFAVQYYSGSANIPFESAGSGSIDMYSQVAAGSTTVNVIPDVSSDPEWSTDSDKNRVHLVNAYGNDVQGHLSMVAKGTNTIQLSAAVNSIQRPLSAVVMNYRNVRLLGTLTSTAQYIVYHTANSNDPVVGHFQCEGSNINPTITGNFIAYPLNAELAGVFGGFYRVCGGGTGNTFSGVFASTILMGSCSNSTLNGTFFLGYASPCTGCVGVDFTGFSRGSYGLFSGCRNVTLSGFAGGDNNGILRDCGGSVIDGLVTNDNVSVVNLSAPVLVKSCTCIGSDLFSVCGSTQLNSGVLVEGSRAVLDSGNGSCFGATIKNCANLATDSIIEWSHVNVINSGAFIGVAGMVMSSDIMVDPPVLEYLNKFDNLTQSLVFMDDGDVAGTIRGWNSGGTITTEDYAPATHGIPPINLDKVYKNSFEASYLNGIEIPILAQAQTPLRILVFIKKSIASMETSPYAKLCDSSYGFEQAGEEIQTVVSADDTDWQTLVIEYTPDYDMELKLRIAGKNGSGHFYWGWMYGSPSSWGNLLIGG